MDSRVLEAHCVEMELMEQEIEDHAHDDVDKALDTCDHRFDSRDEPVVIVPPIQYWAGGSSDD